MALRTREERIMSSKAERTYAGVVKGWKELAGGVNNNLKALPYLELHMQQLSGMAAEVDSLTIEQAAHTAAKQEVTKQIEERIDLGQKLATFLRVGVRQHYGNQSEKLVEFGLQPFRGRKRPSEPIPPPVEQNPPGEAVTPDEKE